jgi:hypothetical protein
MPDAPRKVVQTLFFELRTGNLDAAMQLMHPDVRAQPNVHEEVARILPFFSDLGQDDIRFCSWNYYASSNAPSQHQLTYEIATRNQFLVVFIAVQEHAGQQVVAAFTWQSFEKSPIDFHEFGFENKIANHYFFLSAVMAIPVLCIACLVACWRRRPRRRWLWLLLIVIATPVITFNWSTAEISLELLSVMLLGAGFHQDSRLAPVIFSLGLPIGALLFLIIRPKSVAFDGGVPSGRRRSWESRFEVDSDEWKRQYIDENLTVADALEQLELTVKREGDFFKIYEGTANDVDTLFTALHVEDLKRYLRRRLGT